MPLADVYRARTAIEVSAVGDLAAAPAKTIAKLADLVERGADLLDDAYGFAKHDTAVHQAIVDLAGNQTLSVLASMLLNIMDAHNEHFMSLHGEAHEKQADQLAFRAHRKLVKLLQDGDAAGAQALLAQAPQQRREVHDRRLQDHPGRGAVLDRRRSRRLARAARSRRPQAEQIGEDLMGVLAERRGSAVVRDRRVGHADRVAEQVHLARDRMVDRRSQPPVHAPAGWRRRRPGR